MIDMLVSHRLRVVIFDNRDTGLTSKIEGGRFELAKILDGTATLDPADVPYSLHDMADDILGLMDVLGIERAHLAGASLGGHIVQTFALDHPDRIASLCSIMASTNDGDTSGTDPDALAIFSMPPVTEREDVIERSVYALGIAGSKGLPQDWDAVRATAGAQYDRCFYPLGSGRQLIALAISGDRTELLASVDVPTVVIHGTDDALVHPECGEKTARVIPGAQLVLVEGMGHDLPEAAWDTVIGAITANIDRARAAR
jgi:pimeloyl-ACP methyl ester carboxylesterase